MGRTGNFWQGREVGTGSRRREEPVGQPSKGSVQCAVLCSDQFESPAVRRGVVAALATASLVLSAGVLARGGAGRRRPVRAPPRRPPRGAPAPRRRRASARPAAREGLGEGGVDADRGAELALGAGRAARRRPAGRLARRGHDHTGSTARAGSKTLLGSVPGVSPAGEGGLLGLAVPPTFASDHLVYAYFTTDVRQPHRPHALRRARRPAGQQLGRPGHDPARHPQGQHPQRRPDRVRPGQACCTRAPGRPGTPGSRRTRSPWRARSCG